MDFVAILAKEFNLRPEHVQAVIEMLDAGNTIPFIARYRKEKTGSMDDQTLRDLAERLEYLRNLEKRREEIVKALEEQGVLTDELTLALQKAQTLAELEDIYRPFRPKRRTRATIAKERGLEPLALWLLLQLPKGDVQAEAEKYVDPEKEVPSADDALAGARDILAEQVSDDAALRKEIREMLLREGVIETKAAKEEDSVYSMYYDYKEPVPKMAAHRILAINRGEREEFLKVTLIAPEGKAQLAVRNAFVRGSAPASEQVGLACDDAWERLLFPSLEREIRNELTDRANVQAIHVFSQNLHQLLMQPPIKGKVTLGVDPGFRTGCKLAVIDENGKVLDTGVGHFTLPGAEAGKAAAAKLIKGFVKKVRHYRHRQRQRHRKPGKRAVHRVPAARTARRGLYDRQRGRGLRLFRQQIGGGGIPRFRRDPAQRRFHCPPHAGPPGRAGEDRSQGHRRGPVSARFEAERADRRPGRGGGAVRERRGRGGFHRVRRIAFPRGGHRPGLGEKHRRLPGGKRHRFPRRPEKSAQAGAESL
jgi:hypothetical protein